mgnify:CR=1 FL=1
MIKIVKYKAWRGLTIATKITLGIHPIIGPKNGIILVIAQNNANTIGLDNPIIKKYDTFELIQFKNKNSIIYY